AALGLLSRVLAQQSCRLDQVVRLERRHLFALQLLELPSLQPREPERLPVQRLLEDRARIAGVPEALTPRRTGIDPLEGGFRAGPELVLELSCEPPGDLD